MFSSLTPWIAGGSAAAGLLIGGWLGWQAGELKGHSAGVYSGKVQCQLEITKRTEEIRQQARLQFERRQAERAAEIATAESEAEALRTELENLRNASTEDRLCMPADDPWLDRLRKQR